MRCFLKQALATKARRSTHCRSATHVSQHARPPVQQTGGRSGRTLRPRGNASSCSALTRRCCAPFGPGRTRLVRASSKGPLAIHRPLTPSRLHLRYGHAGQAEQLRPHEGVRGRPHRLRPHARPAAEQLRRQLGPSTPEYYHTGLITGFATCTSMAMGHFDTYTEYVRPAAQAHAGACSSRACAWQRAPAGAHAEGELIGPLSQLTRGPPTTASRARGPDDPDR